MLAKLPQHDDAGTKRADELARARETYQYAYDWPTGVATAQDLPRSQDYGLEYYARSVEVYAKVGINMAAVKIEGFEPQNVAEMVAERFKSLEPHELHGHLFTTPRALAARMKARRPTRWDEYEELFATWDAPEVLSFYKREAIDRDRAFGWQRVAGVNPMVLARCTALPDHFPVDDATFKRAMGDGASLEAALASGRVYLADYAVVDGIETGVTNGVQKYMSAPMALFAVDAASGELRPVIIQVGQSPDSGRFGPSDGWRWRMAQTLVQIADANVHEGIVHLGRTHMVMEAVNLAVRRQLAERHPLFVLFEPHLETTFAINHSAKTSLIAPGGTVDQCFAPSNEAFAKVVKLALDTYPIDQAAPHLDLARRGLDDREALPQHPYREDSAPVWEAIETFVGEYARIYYTSDDDVRGDTELSAFVAELGAEDGGRLKGIPEVNTIDDLVGLVTQLIWIASAGHSCVNFPQFPFMGFVANMPGASYCPPPTADTPDEEASLTAMLPPHDIAVEDVTTIYFLSNLRNSTLGHYGPLHFKDPRVVPVIARFRKTLSAIDEAIAERDPKRMMSYPFLRPSQILQSISI